MKKKMKILTELTTFEKGTNKGKVDWKETVGMIIEVEHYEYGNVRFKVLDFFRKSKTSYIVLDYDGYILERGINTSGFLKGEIGSVMNITKTSKNTFYLDDNSILHIYGENKDGKWEALYSGEHIDEVMNSTWCVGYYCILTKSYNFKGDSKKLHHIDIKPQSHLVIDHISNEFNLIDKFYDNRLDNLREVSQCDNKKNIKCVNSTGYTCLSISGRGYRSRLSYKGNIIGTKTKRDLNEAILDNLIAQRYLGYRHQEEEFYKLDGLSDERIKEVTALLDRKMKKIDSSLNEIKEYQYNINEKNGYYILEKNEHEMLFNCDLIYIKDKYICPIYENHGVYWLTTYTDNNNLTKIYFHRHILGFKPNEYLEYKIHIDHLNNNPSDNRFENLVITTHYGNMCNKIGAGYVLTKRGNYKVIYMRDYRFFQLIDKVKQPYFKTEQEAIQEVERRKVIVNNARVRLKNKLELDELIKYCLDNDCTKNNGLADLDLGYLYWKGILKTDKVVL